MSRREGVRSGSVTPAAATPAVRASTVREPAWPSKVWMAVSGASAALGQGDHGGLVDDPVRGEGAQPVGPRDHISLMGVAGVNFRSM